jgi:sugar phosphate isomerase/epimerase
MIRVYGGRIPEGVSREDADRWVAEGMRQLADYGGKHGVYIAIETHDDYTNTAVVKEVIEQADNEYAAVLWDVHHPYRTVGQSMQECWDNIGRYTVDTHFKDSYLTDEDESGFRYGLMGEGDVPSQEAMQILKDNGYDRYYTLEWEKKWKPYLPEADVGFPQYVEKMKEYWAGLR